MSTQEIFIEALQLPRQSRALLAERLLESLEFSDDFPISEAWLQEIRRRCDDLDQGAVALIPADQVIDEVRKALG